MSQVDLQLDRQTVSVDIGHACRLPSFGKALDFCQVAGGVTDKEVGAELDLDKATWSRIKQTGDPDYGGQKAYFPHHKLIRFMKLCGNRAPLIWLEHQHGDDPRSVRRYQSETEAELDRVRQELEDERRRNQTMIDLIREVRA